MMTRKVWFSIISALVIIQLGGITLYFLRRPRVFLVDNSDLNSVRVFRQEGRDEVHKVTLGASHLSLLYSHSITSNEHMGRTVIIPSTGSEVKGSKVNDTLIPVGTLWVDRSAVQVRVNNLLKEIASRQLSKPMPLVNSAGKLWDKSSFCHKFLIDTFQNVVHACSNDGQGANEAESIICRGNDNDPTHMLTCTLRNLVVQPKVLYESIETHSLKESLFLINDQDTFCAKPTLQFVSKKLEKDDYQLKMLTKLTSAQPKPSALCDVWINKTAIFFINEKYHIYFRLIEYYSVHKALWDLNVNDGDYVVVRISTNEGMMFPEFDDALFPGALNLLDLPQDANVCFKKVVTVPRCFSSVPFRSKMNGLIRNKCFECSGQGLTASPFYTFRGRVLKACNLSDEQPKNRNGTIVVISRKPYVRYPSDQFKRFERVLSNEDKLVFELKRNFPLSNVSVIHLEALPICEQIRYAHSADVLLGVHGAGLVHFWWLRENSLALELEPSFEVGNPTFRMLTTLSGRRYRNTRISGHMKSVTVDIDKVVKIVRESNLFIGNTWWK